SGGRQRYRRAESFVYTGRPAERYRSRRSDDQGAIRRLPRVLPTPFESGIRARGKGQAGMRAARIHEFGPPNVITIDELDKPGPGKGEVLVEVAAAGVGPWDAWIREKKSVVSVPLPLILGSDFCGTVRALGPEVAGFQAGERIYGVTNPSFCGAYAEYAI